MNRMSVVKDHFWTEVNPRVVEVQYAVRGLVPNTAQEIQQELKEGSKSNQSHIQSTPSTR